MTNKEKLIKTINDDFDKNINHNRIVQKMERGSVMKNKFKYMVVPACFILMLSFGLIINNNEKKMNADYENSTNQNTTSTSSNITVNDVENYSQKDLDVKIENDIMIPTFDILLNKKIPDDLKYEKGSSVSVKKNNEYVINNYVYSFNDSKDDRKIVIGISDKNKPLRDYYFTEVNSKKSIINSFELEIFRYDNKFMCMFTYSNYNIDIETTNISEGEFIDLLESIIK